MAPPSNQHIDLMQTLNSSKCQTKVGWMGVPAPGVRGELLCHQEEGLDGLGVLLLVVLVRIRHRQPSHRPLEARVRQAPPALRLQNGQVKSCNATAPGNILESSKVVGSFSKAVDLLCVQI